MYTNTTLTAQVEAPRSKRRSSPCIFHVVVSLSIRSFRTYFPQNFKLFSIRFQCKKYQIFDEKFQILCLYFATIVKHA
jgi:hypothetical protein